MSAVPRARAPIDGRIWRCADGERRVATIVVVALVWAIVVIAIATRHAFWADEVRAFSMATTDDDVVAMLGRIHGDGHPSLWFLLLRGVHAVFASTFVLPATAFAVGAATVLLLLTRSPFAWPLLVLVLAGRFGVYEYVVMARNYGISALLMFAFAATYARHRDHGIVLGVLLALLANTNAPSAVLVVAYLMFWGLDITPWNETQRRVFVRNALIAILGIALSVATVYPTFNDAAQIRMSLGGRLVALAEAVLLPGRPLHEIAGSDLWRALGGPFGLAQSIGMTLLLVASTLGLLHRRAAWVAALAGLIGVASFYLQIYQASYRHQALWIVFLLSLYWLAGPDGTRGAAKLGRIALLVLLGIQVVLGAGYLVPIVDGSAPESRIRDLGRLIASDPRLAQATVMADPDDLVEALPYYVSNPIWLPREQRFGTYAKFTRNARLTLGLDELLADARRLRTQSGQPVLVLIRERLERDGSAREVHEVYNWTLSITPESTARFLDATERLARFGPVCCSPETFDVYLLR